MNKIFRTMMLMGATAGMSIGAYKYMNKNKKMTSIIKNMYNNISDNN